MNQSSFRPRVLLLATALAAAGTVGGQTMGSTPATATDSNASATVGTPAPSTDSKASATAAPPMSSMDSSTSATAGSGAPPAQKSAAAKPDAAKAANAAGASTDNTQVASATHSRTQSKTPKAKASPADTAYRAELRNCVQQTGEQRESCLDQAIEKHERA